MHDDEEHRDDIVERINLGMERDDDAPPDLGVLLLHRRPPPAFPLDVFPPFWSEWMERAAAASAAPIDFIAAPLLAAASATIGNARWVQAHDGWREPPHLWCASVGDSGGSKSPGADAVLPAIVEAIETEMRRDHPDRLREWQQVAMIAKARREQWEDDVAKSTKRGDPPPAMPDGIDVPPEPRLPVLRTSDVTVEKVADLLAHAAQKGLLLTRDELAGWLLGMDAYNASGRAFWLEAYGGRQHRVDRQKLASPIIVQHLAVALWGGIQPDKLASLMRGDDDGLMARLCFFWPAEVPFALPHRPPAGGAADAFLRLHALDMAQGENGPRPVFVPLAPDVLPALEVFARDMQRRRLETAGLLASAYGKARGTVLRLALVMEHLEWAGEASMAPPPQAIGHRAFAAACVLVSDYLMPMAARVFSDAGATQAQRRMATLARWIAKARPAEVHSRSLQREARLEGLKQAEDIKAAAAGLVEAGWLLPPPAGGGFQNRPRVAWKVNPRLWPALDAEPPSDRA